MYIHTNDKSSAVNPTPYTRQLTLDEPRRQLLNAPVEIGNRAALFLLILLLLLLRPRRGGVVVVERGGEGVQDGELFVGVCGNYLACALEWWSINQSHNTHLRQK